MSTSNASPIKFLVVSFFWVLVFSPPLSLLYKVSFGSFDFSVAYLLLIFYFLVFLFLYLLNPLLGSRQFKKRVMVFSLASLFLCYISELGSGFDPVFIFFYSAFVFSIFVGFWFRDYFVSCFNDWIACITFLAVLVGLYFYYQGIPLFNTEYAGGESYFMNENGRYRLTSVLLNPNSFAYFLIFYFSFYLYGEKGWGKNIVCIFVFFSLFITESRTGGLAFLLSLFVFSLQYFKQKKMLMKLSVAGILVILTLLLFFSYSKILLEYDIRFHKNLISYEYIFSSASNFLVGVPTEITVEKDGVVFSDNMFLEFFISTGGVSLLVFIYFYIYSLFLSISILCTPQRESVKPFAIFVISSLPMMFFSNFLMFFPLNIILGVSIGVVGKTGLFRIAHRSCDRCPAAVDTSSRQCTETG